MNEVEAVKNIAPRERRRLRRNALASQGRLERAQESLAGLLEEEACGRLEDWEQRMLDDYRDRVLPESKEEYDRYNAEMILAVRAAKRGEEVEFRGGVRLRKAAEAAAKEAGAMSTSDGLGV